MLRTTREVGEGGQVGHTFHILPPVRSRHHWLFVLLSWITLLTACGGGGSDPTGTAPGPTAQDLQRAQLASLNATLDLSTKLVTLKWTDTFPDASRYQIEQQNQDGSWSAVDAVWATQAPENLFGAEGPLQWTAPLATATTFRVEAMMPAYSVPLQTSVSASSSTANQQIPVTLPSPLPAIVIDQPEPLQGTVGVSISNGGSYANVYYSIDSTELGNSLASASTGPLYSASLSLGNETTGTHLLYAGFQVPDAALTLLLTEAVQVHTNDTAISLNVVSGPSVIDVYVVATSDSNIVSVSADVSAVEGEINSLGSLAAPNACIPTPCSIGQPFNGYHFSFDAQSTGTGQPLIQVQATDGGGHTAFTSDDVSLPSPTAATLDSPVNGASLQGTLPISGTFASGTPGALEVLVTLSGTPVYDTTVANPGSAVPFSMNVSLAGVANGIHTVGVYARVGSASYRFMTSAFVMVTGAQ